MHRGEALEWTWLFAVGAAALIMFGTWAEIIKCILSQWYPGVCKYELSYCLLYAFIITAIISLGIWWIIATRYPQH